MHANLLYSQVIVKLYNSLTQLVEPFEVQSDPLTLYVCGITPYDTTHLGHAFTYTSVDTLIRYLEYKGYQIRYVQNITDIDDDILRKGRESGEDWQALGNRWTRHFIQDMQSLNVCPPDYYPRATEVIPEIITMVANLLKIGLAYEKNGSVYFNVDAWEGFGELSHLPRAKMLPIANERGNRPDDLNKRDPLDFVLWQSQAPGEPTWDSPWDPGRPGWHIECSAMSTKFLGETIDIHVGGGDLIFPHHECEIAQVEPITGKKPFVRFWMHVAMVHHDGSKMSKSLGNLIMVRDLLRTYSPDGLRLYLSSHHYRQSWSYSENDLRESESCASMVQKAASVNGGNGHYFDPADQIARFNAAMQSDLNTPEAQVALFDLADKILYTAGQGRNVRSAQQELLKLGSVFGLQLGQGPDPRVLQGWERHSQKFL